MPEGRGHRDGRWVRLKLFGGLVTVAFVVALALVVGNRLSQEALGVLAGAVCGVSAAIPTSLIVVAVSRWQREGRSIGQSPTQDRNLDREPRHAYPPVVVISPGRTEEAARTSWNALPASSLSPSVDRSFRIVGGAAGDGEGGAV